MVEFVYQFQGFCQYRSQLHIRSSDDMKILAENSSAWSYASVNKLLNGLIRTSGILDKSVTKITQDSLVRLQFGYFASVELARLECLASDHLSSLRALSYIDALDRSDLAELLPTCQVNLYYHCGVSQLLLRRFTDAIDTLNVAVLYISRILKPGVSAFRSNMVVATLNRILERILALLAIAIALSPGHRVDDQVRELVISKFKDSLHKMHEGDKKTFISMFENAAPKFIFAGKFINILGYLICLIFN